MIDLYYNRQRPAGQEEVFAFYRPDQRTHPRQQGPILIGSATPVDGQWTVHVIQDPDGDIIVERQVHVGTFASQTDAVLALLCAECHVEAVLGC